MEDRMTSVRVPGFLPSTRGLHFPNAFPHVPNLEIDLPGGITVPIGDAANGLCGGMAYTVRDLFEARLAPPAMARAPGDGPVFRYVADRLLDSLSLPFGPATYLKLMHPAPPHRALALVRRRGPRGLVKAKSRAPRDLGANHQVLAYGYELDGTRLTLRLYDPNPPDDDQ